MKVSVQCHSNIAKMLVIHNIECIVHDLGLFNIKINFLG